MKTLRAVRPKALGAALRQKTVVNVVFSVWWALFLDVGIWIIRVVKSVFSCSENEIFSLSLFSIGRIPKNHF